MFFVRPQHKAIAELLQSMDASYLEANRCYFGGGTAIVLQNGEYRLSRDVDFLCADQAGYRELRSLAVGKGGAGFFGIPVETVRGFKSDQYGIRGVFAHQGERIKFEIVREARIELSGSVDQSLGVPVLSMDDQFAEKLMANADRWLDKAVAYRDAIDLGYLVSANGGGISPNAVVKAEAAYGRDILRAIGGVLGRLSTKSEMQYAASSLEMKLEDVHTAASHLHSAAIETWPELEFHPFPSLETVRSGPRGP